MYRSRLPASLILCCLALSGCPGDRGSVLPAPSSTGSTQSGTTTPLSGAVVLTGLREDAHAIVAETADLVVRLERSPWRVVVIRRSGGVVLEGAPAAAPYPAGGAVGYQVNPTRRVGGGGLSGLSGVEHHSVGRMAGWNRSGDQLLFSLDTDEVVAGTPVSVSIAMAFTASDSFTVNMALSHTGGIEEFGETFLLAPGEEILGLGQHFDAVGSRGRWRAMQPEILTFHPFTIEEVHVPVPLIYSSRGVSVFVEDRHRGGFDVGRAAGNRLHLGFRTGALSYHVDVSDDPAELLRRFIRRTGLPARAPMWAFGHHQWRNRLERGDRDVRDDMAAMRAADIPNSAIWLDAPWETAYNTFAFNPVQFPDPDALLADMAADGNKVLVWATEYLNVTDDSGEMAGMESHTRGMYTHADRNGYLVRTSLGGTALLPWWKGWGAFLDFSQPAATAWWQSNVRQALRKGISGFKLDAGEALGPLATADIPLIPGLQLPFEDSRGPIKELGPYRMGYHRAFADLIEYDLQGDGMIVSRAGCFGDQVNAPFIWPGDLDNDFSVHVPPRIGGLPAAIVAGISVGLVGFPFFAPDVGGFLNGTPSKNSLIRWAQFGALCPVMQLGGGGNHRPWDTSVFDAETLRIYRKYARLHHDLAPYIYSYASEAFDYGMPVIRSLALHHPDDPAAWREDYTYLFGEELLVAPVYEDVTAREVYLPRGRWIDFWDRTEHVGPKRFVRQAPLDTLPLFVKAGAIIPLLDPEVDTLAPATNPGVVSFDQRRDHLRLWVWPDGDSHFRLYDGTLLESRETSSQWQLEISGAPPSPRELQIRVDWRNRRITATAVPGSVTSIRHGPLTQHASRAAFDASSEGWWFDAAEGLLWILVSTRDDYVTVR